MANQLSTQLVYLDVKTILQNYKDPKFWSKEWLIFENKDFTISWRMTNINVIDNSINSNIIVRGRKGQCIFRNGHQYSMPYDVDKTWSFCMNSCHTIPINHDEYTQELLNNNLKGTILYCLTRMEKAMIENTVEYQRAESVYQKERDRLRDIARAFLDEHEIENEKVRRCYEDAYVNANSDCKIMNDIKEHSQFRFFKTAYLHVCSWFNDEKKFNEYKELLKKYVHKNKSLTIWRKDRLIQTEKWKESMKEKLTDI